MKYKNAPIKEAIFDIRIDNLEQGSIKELELFHDFIKDEFPEKKKQISFVGKIQLKEGVKVQDETDSHMKGFVFLSQDSKTQVQIKIDGFTLNQLSPYDCWESFSSQALELWKLYEEKYKPQNITRIALRYINKIELPLPVNRLEDYILNIPPIPKNLPKLFEGFFMQIQVPVKEIGSSIIINETIENLTKSHLPFILDLDAFQVGKIDKDATQLKIEFDKLRELKNNTFESCITDKARELFN